MKDTLPESRSSRKVVASVSHPGVEFVLGRMTFGRRIDLMRRIRDLAVRVEYFEAGRDAKNQMEASRLGAEIDAIYVEWGVEEIRGIEIDNEPLTPRLLIDRAPEALFLDALAAVKAGCGLNEAERKN